LLVYIAFSPSDTRVIMFVRLFVRSALFLTAQYYRTVQYALFFVSIFFVLSVFQVFIEVQFGALDLRD